MISEIEGTADFLASGDVEGLFRYLSVDVPSLDEATEEETLGAIIEEGAALRVDEKEDLAVSGGDDNGLDVDFGTLDEDR
jgi:hypothetical protein